MAYILALTREETESLSWVSARYHSAQVLYDALDLVDGEDDLVWDEDPSAIVKWQVSEAEAWEYREALESEDGSPLIPPCIGGKLADKLLAFWQSIV